MSKKEIIFPDGFYWGSSTSSHQVEGGNYNDWTIWEKKSADKLAMEAKNKWENWQQARFPEMFEKENYISGNACDHYNKFEEDFELARSLNHTAHRFSLEWSRIEPKKGKFNEKEIEHYRKVLKALRKRNIEPFVTLWHWTNPIWIRDIGGWENKDTVGYFLKYVSKIADSLGSEIKFWIPINEPSVFAGHSYLLGFFPPQKKSFWLANKVIKNLTAAHIETYKLLHNKLGDNAKVGSAHNYHYHVPFRKNNPLDKLLTKLVSYVRDVHSSKDDEKYEDFIGLNYYFRDTIKFTLWNGRYPFVEIKNPYNEVSDMNWDIFPEGIYHVLKEIKKCKKPIYITENGVADKEDFRRSKFIKEHLFWIHKAIKEGADVRGYLHWSLLDNFEWDKGFWPRFGLVEVDKKSLKRKIRPSALEYAKICKENRLILE